MKTQENSSVKSYARCLSCPRFKIKCGGRPTRDMDLETWCEYMRDVKELFHLTNAYIAKESDVSIKTIERITAINIDQDIMRSTARRIELAIIGPVRDHICYVDQHHTDAQQIAALQAENTALREEVAFWRKENDRKAKIIDKYLD